MDVREIVFNRCQRKLYFLTAFELDHFPRFLYVFFFYWRKTRGDMQIKIMFRCYSIFQMARNLIFCMFFFLNLICKFDQLSQKVLDIW